MNQEDNKNNNKELEEKLALAEKERDEYLNGWKRAKADMINSKKESEDQLKNLSDFVKMDFIKQFLPVLDALELAPEIEGWREVKKLVNEVMVKNKVEEIGGLGDEFDPAYHEAVGEGEGSPGQVVEVMRKGYVINGRVIRPAKVRIGKHSSS